MPISQLRRENPWWQNKTRIENDKNILELKGSSISYDPELRRSIRYDFEFDNAVVYTLRGPRQVGKTTLIKIQIRDFLMNKQVCPWNIFYYSFDLTESRREMVETIDAYMKLSRRYKKATERTYLFLDEVTSISDWQKGIKWLADRNIVQNCTILATGSCAMSIVNAAERLPGRKGRTDDGHNKILRPMTFSEFVRIQNKDIAEHVKNYELIENSHDIFHSIYTKNMPEEIDILYNNFAEELHDCLDEYLITGGTPKIVNERIKTGFVHQDTYSDYLDGLRGDWGSRRNESHLRQFVTSIINSMGSSTSWSKMQQMSELGSWTTVQEYAGLLRDLSIISIIHKYNPRNKTARITKEKKIYFHDPFYLHMFNGWASADDPFEQAEELLSDSTRCGHVVEGVVADHLTRQAFKMARYKHVFDYSDHVFYWKNHHNREVDFVLYADGLELPIEVKYRNTVNKRELDGMVSFLDQANAEGGLVLSKKEIEQRQDYLIIPAAALLLLI